MAFALHGGTAHSHAYIFGSSHSAGILRMYEEWNKDPAGVAECMEKHGFVDTDKYVMHFLNTGAQFTWKEAREIHPAMMNAFTHVTLSVCELIESGNSVSARVTVSAFHTKPYVMPGLKIAESGEFFRAHMMLNFHFGPTGKITEVYMITNLFDVLRENLRIAEQKAKM